MNTAVLILSFSLAVFAVIINGVTQLFYARSLGYQLKPTAFAYFVGAFGNLLTGNVVPISGQAETLTISSHIKDFNVRIAALLFASIVGVFLGLTGSISTLVDFAGETIIIGMMAGVGLILSEVAIILIRKDVTIGFISFVSAVLVWFLSHDLIYTISVSVISSTLYYVFPIINSKRKNINMNLEPIQWRFWKKEFWSEFKLVKPTFNLQALIGGLGIICLNIGTNISFGTISSSIANLNPQLDVLTVINSLADIPSIVFGGVPIEAIISGTAASPWPVLAGIMMMVLTGTLLLVGVVDRIAHLVPPQSIAGFLFVIGFNLTLVPNLLVVARSEASLEGIVAATITMLTKNAFFGVLAGISIRLFSLLGFHL